MRIAYLVSQYPAASHTFIRREVAGLRARGFEVETFSIRPPTGVSKLADVDQREAETTWYVLPASAARIARSHARALLKHPGSYVSTLRRALGHRVPGLRALLWAAFHFAESIDLASEIERRGVDHLHNHFANSGANVGLLAAHFLRLNWSLTLHGTSEFDYPAGQLLAEKIEAARFVACVTHFGRAQAMRIVDPKHWHKFVIVRAGIERPPLPPRDGPAPGANGSAQRSLVLCVARLSPEKGHAGLLQAFAHLVAGGVDAQLELLGDGPERQRIEEQIRILGLTERVKMRGQVSEDQVLEALTRATVLVLASFMEGLPVTLMEALALGVPVVAPCVAGIPELVEHGVSGLTFPPGDWDRLAQVLRDLLADPALQQRLAREGRRRVESEYFVERSLEPLVGAFGLPGVL
ncbi:MAG TPA: glycosyltransferase [Polyangiaceae bacterium]|nr:glycosyltransferase [Polyangiaceae bacterium]